MNTWNNIKSSLLITASTAVLGGLGYAIGESSGMLIAAVLAFAYHGVQFWWGAELAVRSTGARVADPSWPPDQPIIRIATTLAVKAGMPVPFIGIMDDAQPNALATGRDPEHAVLIVTSGLSHYLTPEECEGVIAHEMAHIQARDTLTAMVSASVASAVGLLAGLLAVTGLVVRRHGGLLMVGLALLSALSALVLQMTLSRTREYEADRAGTKITGNPKALASALRKIAEAGTMPPIPAVASHLHLAPMFFVNPLGGAWIARLFDTHPPIEKRIAKLEAM